MSDRRAAQRSIRSAHLARAAAAVAVAVAVTTLIGWAVGSPRPRSFVDPRWQTNPITPSAPSRCFRGVASGR